MSFSLYRLRAVVIKEFIQMVRDRLTLGMMIGIPLIQIILFGFAINSDPKNLPAAVYSADRSIFSRTLLAAIRYSGYFRFLREAENEAEMRALIARGKVQFIVHVPEDFSRKLLRGERPQLLLEADATDPAATSNAIAAINKIMETALNRDLKGVLSSLQPVPPPLEIRVHPRYNPSGITQYNIVPGLMGVVLTMTMVIITSLAITRERERGTMENLLATPVRPLEVILGKIIPYILFGYLQSFLILLAAKYVFDVPMRGSLLLLLSFTVVFVTANLGVGVTFSTLAKNQLQAVQMSFFFFLPSILLSGFMFPFRGMPQWAQYLGEILPLTHFLRLVRGILLKGNDLSEALPHLLPITLFLLIALSIGLIRYRKTLD